MCKVLIYSVFSWTFSPNPQGGAIWNKMNG